MTKVRGNERGAALVVVIIVSLLVGSVGVSLWTVSRVGFLAAERRIASAQAQWMARSVVASIPGWFQEREVGALIAPPNADEIDRDRREVDADGDGRFESWTSASSPWNVRYKEGSDDALFRPPLSSRPDEHFAGSREGPDLLLEQGGVADEYLEEWIAALEPDLPLRIRSVRIFGPYHARSPEFVATVSVEVARRFPGSLEVVRRAEGQLRKVFFERFDRPIFVGQDAFFSGEASWGYGEAVIGGDLHAAQSTWEKWPGGVPWLAPDRPLLDDSDSDGTPDDADSDGKADLSAWRSLPGAVADPWWRARVGGDWPDLARNFAECEAPFPFGPRADPPEPASKSEDRSGLFLECPLLAREAVLPDAWLDLARSGVRGAVYAIEDEEQPGKFRRDGIGEPLSPDSLLGGHSGLVLLEVGKSDEASLRLDGASGAWLVVGGDLRAHGVEDAESEHRAPGDLADYGGIDRADEPGDRRLDSSFSNPACSSWEIGTFLDPGDPALDPLAHDCEAERLHFRGLLAAERALTVDGPLRMSGQVRAGELKMRGESEVVSVRAEASAGFDTSRWPGPEGVPRFHLSEIRDPD